MAISLYTKPATTIPISAELVTAYSEGVQSKTLLTALGDYWSDYYIDADTLSVASTGAVALYSQEYSKMLDYVLASNIIDVPVDKPFAYQLFGFSEEFFTTVYAADGSIDYYSVPFPGVESTEFFLSSLFEPEVILEKGKNFEIVDGELRWYVDIFADKNVTDYSYTIGTIPNRQILLWATNIAFEDYLIFERYGRFLYKKDKDSDAYHWLITALLHYYTNTKSLDRIEAVLNVLYGLPLSRYNGEVVTSIDMVDRYLKPVARIEDATFRKVVTSKTEYYVYSFAELIISVGDILNDYQLLAKFHVVEDYVSNPDWYKTLAFPDELVVSNDDPELLLELMDKVLKYNIVYVRMVITWDTYSQYKAQLEELYTIIKSGFPVYLYPFVDMIFQANLDDTVAVSDNPGELGIQFSQEDLYERCYGGRTFSGRTTYFSAPILDYGSKYSVLKNPSSSVVDEAYFEGDIRYDGVYAHEFDSGPEHSPQLMAVYHLTFGGDSNYDHYDGDPDFHRPWPKDCPRFDGVYQYSKPVALPPETKLFEFGYDCVTDPFVLTMDSVMSDSFQWSTIENPVDSTMYTPHYGSKYDHTGKHEFRPYTLVEHYEFWISIKQMFEEFIAVSEKFETYLRAEFVETVGTCKYFNGQAPYAGSAIYEYNIGETLTFAGAKKYDEFDIHSGASRGTANLEGVTFDYDKVIKYDHSGWYTDKEQYGGTLPVTEEYPWEPVGIPVAYASEVHHGATRTFGSDKFNKDVVSLITSSTRVTDTYPRALVDGVVITAGVSLTDTISANPYFDGGGYYSGMVITSGFMDEFAVTEIRK